MSECKSKVYNWLCREVPKGIRYFKAKHIGAALGISAKEAAAALREIIEDAAAGEVQVIAWSRSSAVTYQVQRLCP